MSVLLCFPKLFSLACSFFPIINIAFTVYIISCHQGRTFIVTQGALFRGLTIYMAGGSSLVHYNFFTV